MKNVIEKKVTGAECAAQTGVSQCVVTAVKKMIGLAGCRKVYPTAIGGFLKRYQDFRCEDARDERTRAAFAVRHPEFKLPGETGRYKYGFGLCPDEEEKCNASAQPNIYPEHEN